MSKLWGRERKRERNKEREKKQKKKDSVNGLVISEWIIELFPKDGVGVGVEEGQSKKKRRKGHTQEFIFAKEMMYEPVADDRPAGMVGSMNRRE